MLKYFWADHTEIPEEIVTRNFSTTHIVWFFCALALIFAVLFIYRRVSVKARRTIKAAAAVIMLVSEVSVWIWKAAGGHYSFDAMLPLHLCGVSIFVEAAAVFAKKNELLKEFSYCLSMPGAFGAILTPGWYYPFISFQYLQSALLHTLLILLPVLFVWGDGFRPDWRRLPKCFALLLFFAGIAAGANALLDANYMYLCHVPKDTVLQLLEAAFGHPGYIIPVIGIIFIIWAALYLPWVFTNAKNKRQAKGGAF